MNLRLQMGCWMHNIRLLQHLKPQGLRCRQQTEIGLFLFFCMSNFSLPNSKLKKLRFFSLTRYSRSFIVLHCTHRSLLHFNQISLKCIWLISSLSCWYGCPSVLELFLIGLFKHSLNWLCSFQGKPTQYHSNASLPQPLMLKKVKLKSSMKTYKTFYN